MRKFAILFISVIQLCCLTTGQDILPKIMGDSINPSSSVNIETVEVSKITASLVNDDKATDSTELVNTGFVLSKKPMPASMGMEEIEIFPNPAHEVLYIRNVRNNILVCMYDIRGILVLRRRLENEKVAIDHLPNGVYFVKFREKRNTIISKFKKKELAI